MVASQPVPFAPSCLNISHNYSGFECEIIVRQYLKTYIENGNYFPTMMPAKDGSINVSAALTFSSLNEISINDGYMSMSGNIDLIWIDEFLKWDSKLTPGTLF